MAKHRIGDIETLQEEISAWGNDVNDTQRGVDGQMKIDDTRTKLKSVYRRSGCDKAPVEPSSCYGTYLLTISSPPLFYLRAAFDQRIGVWASEGFQSPAMKLICSGVLISVEFQLHVKEKSMLLRFCGMLAIFGCVGLWASGSDAAEPYQVDLGAQNAAEQWTFLTPKTASISHQELILDGRSQISTAFLKPVIVGDAKISAKFRVEDQAEGVLACGFVFGAVDSRTFHYVHFDRGQAILVRSIPDVNWTEIQRVSGLNKPTGQWHSAEIDCHNQTVSISLNGKKLFEATAPELQAGRIGFYGSQGQVQLKDISILGDVQKTDKEFAVHAPQYLIVCDDGGAGAYEAFPDVCRLNDGRLMAVFYAGYGHVSVPSQKYPLGGRISYCMSNDEGLTWTPAQTLFDGPDDDRDPSIVQLPSGKLLCNFFTYDGHKGIGTWIVSSDDLGQSWTEPQLITLAAYCSSPIRLLSTGRLIMPLYTAKSETATGAIAYSDDDGATWSDITEIDNGGIRLDAETDVIELKDKSLFAALRAHMCSSISKDHGETWSVAQPMGFSGHCPYFLRTPNDEIVLAFRIPNTSLRISRDECKTWSENVLVDNVIGAYPSLVNLKDGSILIVYYEEGTGSNIRAKKFRITGETVEFLPLKAESEE